jgi:hypothetical protein
MCSLRSGLCNGPGPVPDNAKIAVPTGYCEFPARCSAPHDRVARTYADLRRSFRSNGITRSPRRRDTRVFPAGDVLLAAKRKCYFGKCVLPSICKDNEAPDDGTSKATRRWIEPHCPGGWRFRSVVSVSFPLTPEPLPGRSETDPPRVDPPHHRAAATRWRSAKRDRHLLAARLIISRCQLLLLPPWMRWPA